MEALQLGHLVMWGAERVKGSSIPLTRLTAVSPAPCRRLTNYPTGSLRKRDATVLTSASPSSKTYCPSTSNLQ